MEHARVTEHFILNGRELVPATLLGWAAWFEESDRHVAKTRVRGMLVSTIFLGVDHAWPGGVPQLFETMIFKGWYASPVDGRRFKNDVYGGRYATYDEAERSHKAIVRSLRLSRRQRKRPTCKRGAVVLELSAD